LDESIRSVAFAAVLSMTHECFSGGNQSVGRHTLHFCCTVASWLVPYRMTDRETQSLYHVACMLMPYLAQTQLQMRLLEQGTNLRHFISGRNYVYA
jgi:hypothetical protein